MKSTVGYARLSLALAALCIVAPATPFTAVAQTEVRRPVVVALPDAFPDMAARAILVLEPHRSVVLMKSSDVSPETLDTALRVLGRVETRPPREGRGLIVPVTGYVRDAALAPERRLVLANVLSRLRSSPVVQIGGMGPGRWVPYRVR